MTTYFVEARSGDSWEGKELHGDPECPDGPSRPITGAVVGPDAEYCECVPFGDASDGASSDTDETASDSPQSESSSDGGDGSDGEDDGEDEDDGPTCAATTSEGESCSRPVDEEGDFCFQHSE